MHVVLVAEALVRVQVTLAVAGASEADILVQQSRVVLAAQTRHLAYAQHSHVEKVLELHTVRHRRAIRVHALDKRVQVAIVALQVKLPEHRVDRAERRLDHVEFQVLLPLAQLSHNELALDYLAPGRDQVVNACIYLVAELVVVAVDLVGVCDNQLHYDGRLARVLVEVDLKN